MPEYSGDNLAGGNGAATLLKRRSLVALVTLIAAPLTPLSPSSPAAADQSTSYKIGYGDYGNTYLINPDGTDRVKVANAFFADFDWTADGEKFVWRENQSPGQLWIRNQDGREFPVGDIGGSDPELSPDGTKIAYTDYDPALDEDVVNVVDLSGNFVATLGPGSQPAWSPDGTKIAFAKKGERSIPCGPESINVGSDGLAVAPATGGGSSWLVEPSKPAGGGTYWKVGGGADWSPDGTEIVLEGYAERYEWDEYSGRCQSEWVGGNDFDVYKVASGGGSPVNLTDGAAWIGGTYEDEPADLNPSFSPDGEQIAFASDRNAPRDGGIHSLWKMNANGGGQTLVKAADAVYETDWMTPLPAGAAVRINALDPCATEEGATPGTFTIERTGATDGSVDVTIRVASTSTATSNADFPEIPTTVTIPADTTLVNLVVFPTDDETTEPEETIDVEIVSAEGGLLVGRPSKATIRVADDDGGPEGTCSRTPTHKRSISLGAKHVGTRGSTMLKLSGRLSVEGDANGCIRGAKVLLERFNPKTKKWAGVGDDTTDATGRYAHSVADTTGKYRATVKPQKIDIEGLESSCSAASKSHVHKH